MSAQEIIEELPKLTADELAKVRARVLDLTGPPKSSWGKALLEIAGTVDDLPSDMSANVDHYLYGTPKKTET